ncbi:LOW QUALITY PROTEIN: tumor necrosis factor ligand superfamily member 6 [Cyclopterus lumpus]|uniref:LOW QUALITY PROTEIN: tumor necrosis factor ligand superfamily member 6 n=1 Tax=Cyclopterus lumpus TaxID=8103 RepID=UPI0014874525|nr:LOW QUALITY PROTEIN: tumor necrosis factor ligand superfamily member 6 [Cyclopterus lumpus]
MSGEQQSYPFPQVFLVDGGGPQHSAQQPSLVPCWSFPPAQERARPRGKSRGCMGVGPGAALVVLMLFLLVFVSLGFEAYQIHNMQVEMREMRKVTTPAAAAAAEFQTPQKQIAHQAEVNREDDDDEEEDRPAAHVIGRIETEKFPRTLRWEPLAGRAFTAGAVEYRFEDGALQPNESGLYHVYSRVELIFKDCSPSSSFVHSVFVRRGGGGRSSPLTLMEAHREGFCSQQRGHAWTAESYLASAHQLQRADRVFVNVSHPFYLSHSHYANFFGLYKI